MVRRFTFRGLIITYTRTADKHRMFVDLNPDDPNPRTDVTMEVGPLVPSNRVLMFEWDGRYFIGQALTEDMPLVFELVPSMETTVQLKVLPEEKPN